MSVEVLRHLRAPVTVRPVSMFSWTVMVEKIMRPCGT